MAEFHFSYNGCMGAISAFRSGGLKLGAALIAAVLLAAQSHVTSPSRQAPAANQQTAIPTRGSEVAPVFVKVMTERRSAADTAKEDERAKESFASEKRLADLTQDLAAYTKYLFYATAALATLTLGLLIASFMAARDSRRAAEAAKEQVTLAREEFNATHRPKLEVRFLRRTPEGQKPGVEITVINTGDADARWVEGRARFHWVADDDAPSPHDIGANYAFNLRKLFVPSGADRCIIPVDYGDDEETFDNVFSELTGTKIMCLFGWIVYEGIQTPRRTTFFARVYDPKSRAFRDLPDYPDWNMIQ